MRERGNTDGYERDKVSVFQMFLILNLNRLVCR